MFAYVNIRDIFIKFHDNRTVYLFGTAQHKSKNRNIKHLL